ncbi:hypothetical protein [Castellaniella ginsengisoli]|uniref:Uncharacterized protein n=1 Tax=Castellaniella ginsengisoli TaxID=546114 RepID=A0AB39D5V0_9BURK
MSYTGNISYRLSGESEMRHGSIENFTSSSADELLYLVLKKQHSALVQAIENVMPECRHMGKQYPFYYVASACGVLEKSVFSAANPDELRFGMIEIGRPDPHPNNLVEKFKHLRDRPIEDAPDKSL